MPNLPAEAYAIIEGRHSDPFHYLGLHPEGDKSVVRAFLPEASNVEAVGEPPLSDRIVSTAASGAAAAAFARLASVPRERRRDSDILLGAGDRTLEEIVRDVLRPLLQAWLDDNLPQLVERLVRAEISRVVGEAGLH